MRYFGTDGVRGTVGQHPMTAEFALRLAGAATRALLPRGGKVVIGKDTRVSGYMFESALEAGFVAAGADVRLSGPLPTPGVALLTQELGADLGVVISASHNAYGDNGIKFFKHDGFKLAAEEEARIESHIEDAAVTLDSTALGQVRRVDDALERYEQHCLGTVPGDMSLEGVKIVVDCAHGASYRVAPATLTALGAELVPLGCSPNGRNINDRCGATEPDLLRRTVKAVEADVGIALDGDGDRVIMVDSGGATLNGDTLLLVLALARKEAGRLTGPVVGTQISSMALERALQAEGIAFCRAEVGDRHVVAMLREKGGVLGGESSGHILCLDKSTTGDGLLVALEVLSVMQARNCSLAELAEDMPHTEQANLSVPSNGDGSLGDPAVEKALRAARRLLGQEGRIVVRPSGTEPVFRIMAEGSDRTSVHRAAEGVAQALSPGRPAA
ncbi:MAG: phosphoglucosamine mutase [Gammaproteobacteria bacterium]|nr:phosphoglucosamine mutase [Gammaproteobacteria bacterium]